MKSDTPTSETFIRKALGSAVARYLAPDRPSIARCHRELRVVVAAENDRRGTRGLLHLACPSASTLRREIARLDPLETCAARFGRAAANRLFRDGGARS